MNKQPIPYNLIYSDRRGATLRVNRDGRVEVRAPRGMPRSEIERFVNAHRDWIERNLARILPRAEAKAAFKVDYGSALRLLGHTFPLAARDGTRAGFDGSCFFAPPGLQSERLQQVCVNTYRRYAADHIPKRVTYFAEIMHAHYDGVKINSAKARWGSCSGKCGLNFSWLLIMAPPEVVDYVVVHELSHTFEHNHSDRFWAVVERALPDWRQREAGLKPLQEQLSTENW